MNKLEKLIAKLCPNGVEYKTLGDVCFYSLDRIDTSEVDEQAFVSVESLLPERRGRIVSSSFPKEGRLIAYDIGDVLIGNIRPYLKKIWLADMTGGTNGDVLVVKRKNENEISSGYLYHLLSSDDFFAYDMQYSKGAKMPRGDKSAILKYVIPVPPLPVQEEIVRMLDEMAGLIDELEQELVARKQQYEWYLDSYFRCSKAKRIAIKDIGVLTRGKRFVHADAVESGVPCVHYGEIYTRYGVFADVAQSNIRRELGSKMRYAHKNDVIIVGAGENSDDIGIGVSWEGDCDVAVHDACYTLVHAQNPRYVSYFLRSKIYHSQIKRFVSEGKICSISAEGVGRALIPIPIRSEQDAVAKSFDDFELLCREVLPSEIALRKQQYEYYRDRLLTFKRVG